MLGFAWAGGPSTDGAMRMAPQGPAWGNAPGDPRMGFDAPTAPLPYGVAQDPGQDYPDDLDPGEWARPRRRRWRVLRRIAAVLMGLAVLGVATFGVLLLITPSVNDAAARARAIARVTAATVTGRGDQGGATLYQQLAKMLYTPRDGGIRAEIEQVMLGIKLDLTFPKARILRMYADVAYFGHGYYGLAAASCGYFGTTPAGLTLPEAATLAGLVQGPSADDPITHYALARGREAHVLGRLVSTG